MSMRVPFAASSVAAARRELKRWMVQHGAPRDRVEDARIVISEMVGNAVRHAQALPDGNILITWCLGDQGLELSVTDGGSSTRPMKVNASSSALTGRGMSIVDTLAASWWTEHTRSRSTVHALLAMA